MDTAFEIIKWVVLILLAGFIGQFGKSLSLRLMHHFQERKKQKTVMPAPTTPDTAVKTNPGSAPATDQKAVKKMLKAEIKANKKSAKLKSKA